MPTAPIATAQLLAWRGWPVLPCHHPAAGRCSCGDPRCPAPAKHPRVDRGLHAADTDPAVIERWWHRWPDANLAVRTGAAPDGAGLVVLDIDPAHGGAASLAALTEAHGALPATLEVHTGGGGSHQYFAHPGRPVPNSAGRLGPGLDVRGDSGYVLVPPSRHVSGGRYRWLPGPLALLPGWLTELVVATPVSLPAAGPRRPGAWAAAALAGEEANVRGASEGCRNYTLNRAAFALGQLVAAGHLDTDVVTAVLTRAGLDAGLTRRETLATITSGLTAGAARPRHPVPR
jgi:hypothetical protein